MLTGQYPHQVGMFGLPGGQGWTIDDHEKHIVRFRDFRYHDRYPMKPDGPVAATDKTDGYFPHYRDSDLGFYDMMETRGYDRAQVDHCLGDENAIKEMAEKADAAARKDGVNSTPSFLLNGQLLEGVHTWGQLQNAVTTPSE